MLPHPSRLANLDKITYQGDALAFKPLFFILPQHSNSISFSQVREKGNGFQSSVYIVFGPDSGAWVGEGWGEVALGGGGGRGNPQLA
jgi:hypothetical protein